MATDWSILPQLFYDGSWHILPGTSSTTDAYVADTPVELWRGVDRDGGIEHGKLSFRINDPPDEYRPSNAAGPLYGTLRQYMRGAFASASSVRFAGEVTSFQPDETADHQAAAGVTTRGNRWVDVEVGGLLARIGQWRDTLDSPMTAHIKRYASLRGYWPMEEEQGASSLSNLSGPAASISGATPGDSNRPAGSARAVACTANTQIRGRFGALSATGWQIQISVYVESTSGTLGSVLRWRDSLGRDWLWQMSNGGMGLVIKASDGTVLLSEAYGGFASQQWITSRIKVSHASGTVTIEPAWYVEDSPVLAGVTTSFSGAAAAPKDWQILGNSILDGARVGQLFAVTGVGDDLQSGEMVSAINGYNGERAADRFARNCIANGVDYQVLGTAAESVRMGPQPIGTLQDVINDCRQTEDGLIFDRRGNVGAVFATRGYRCEQASDPALTLTWPDDMGAPMKEVTAARNFFNLVTAKDRNTGQLATAQNAGGALGTAAAGQQPKTVEVNLYNQLLLPDVASWWLSRYRAGSSRFDTIVVDLDSYSGDLTDLQALDIGMCVVVEGRTPDPLVMQIIGIGETRQRKRAKIVFTVEDATPLVLGIYDDAGSRYDSLSTTVDGDHTSGDTTLALSITYMNDWWATGGGFDWLVDGEMISVTSVTSHSGTGPYTQTATVQRAQNGVVKAIADGTEVHLHRQVRYGWGD